MHKREPGPTLSLDEAYNITPFGEAGAALPLFQNYDPSTAQILMRQAEIWLGSMEEHVRISLELSSPNGSPSLVDRELFQAIMAILDKGCARADDKKNRVVFSAEELCAAVGRPEGSWSPLEIVQAANRLTVTKIGYSKETHLPRRKYTESGCLAIFSIFEWAGSDNKEIPIGGDFVIEVASWLLSNAELRFNDRPRQPIDLLAT